MKVSLISLMQGFPWGGSEELWFQTIVHTSEKNHEVQVFVKHWENKSEKIGLLEKKGIKVSFYDKPTSLSSSFVHRLKNYILKKLRIKKQNPGKWGLTIEKMKEFNPDFLIVNQGGTFDLAHETDLYNFLKQNNIPYLVICQYLSDLGISLRGPIQARAIELMQKAKQVYFVSERNKITAERLLAFKLTHAQVINNPVNLETKELIPYPPLEGNCLNLACVARLDIAYKGQDSLLQVLSSKKWKERNWILTFYGTGPDKELLEKQILYFGLKEKVVLAGQVSDIKAVWAKSHLLVLPSIGEGTPLALAESMLCGRTALVTSAGGNPELICNGVNGFVAACALPEYLDEAMEQAWIKRNEWEQMGKLAHMDSSKRYKEKAGEVLLNSILEKIQNSSQN
jgi:glycosyltransferase involved in cell wall biosynthesis